MPIIYGSNYKGKKVGQKAGDLYGQLERPEDFGIIDDTLAKKIGLETNQEKLLASVPRTSGGGKPATLADVALRGVAARKIPASIDRTAALGKASGVSGLRTTSAGATYGSAGRDTLGTSVYDAAGNTVYGTIGGRNVIGGAPKGIDRSAGVPQDPYEEYMRLLSPQSVIDRQKQIRNEVERTRQAQIDAIQQSTQSQIETQNQATQEDLARQRSLNLRAGLGGSDFGAANKMQIRDQGRKAVVQIQANQELAIGNIIDSIDQLANERFQIEQSALQQGMQNTMQYQQYQQQQRQNAVTRIAELGKAGLDIPTIKERDPQLYDNLITASGMSGIELEAVINNSKPAPQRIDYQYKVMGGKLVAFGVDPTTGRMKVMEQEVDIPDNYSVSTMPDGTVLGVPENWDGDTSKIVTVGNYRKPFESEVSGGGSSGDITMKMTTQQRSALNAIVDKYNKSPLVAAADRTIVLKDSIKNVRNDPSNGTLQLNLVYSYIQALDTYQSAVREGELSLVNSIDSKVGQLGKYVQSIQNGEIVRPEVAKEIANAAEKIVTTINEGAKRKQQQFRSQANVNGIANQWDSYISGYGGGFDTVQPIQNDPETQRAQSAAIGEKVFIGGTLYIKTGEDNYEPAPVDDNIRNTLINPVTSLFSGR